MSYIFDASKGETPQSVARQRAIAEALMGRAMRGGAPRTIGDGLTLFGQALSSRMGHNAAAKAETAGREGADSVFNAIRSGLLGGGGAAPMALAPVDTPAGMSTPPQPVQENGPMAGRFNDAFGGNPRYRDAIASIESAGSGDYAAIGPTHPKLGRALGRYQVMESNIGPWSREALGREVTPDEFMASPQLQDAIFDHRFGKYAEQYGPEGAAQAWFGGPGGVGKTERTDSLGTSIGAYTDKFSNALGGMPAGGVPQNGQEAISSAMAFAPGQGGMQVADASGGVPQMPQAGQGGPSMEQLLQAASNPWLSESQRSVVNMLLEQEMQRNDPMRRLQMQKMQREMDRPDLVNAGDGRLYDPRTREWITAPQVPGSGSPEVGLNPQYGVDAQGNPVLLQLGKNGQAVQTALPEGVKLSKEPIRMDAGTHFVLLDPITRQPVGTIPKDLAGAEREKAVGSASGKAEGEALAAYRSMTSKMPGLEGVVQTLDGLAEKATYTIGGQAVDWTMRQAGMEPREAAVARSEYTAIVDNQILPLLRDTFGAQFTQKEGDTLRATLGDPDKSPQEKQALLRAFIEQKRRDIGALASQAGIEPADETAATQGMQGGVMPGVEPRTTPVKRLRFNPATGDFE